MGITDADGKTKAEDGDSGYAYTYQWILVDGNTETDISGEMSSTYMPSSSDVGKTIKVRVSFTDDLDNAEGPFTSEQTAAVTEVTVAVTIASNHPSIGAGLEDLVFTLTRTGATTDELEAMVTIVQEQSWLGTSDLSHDVTFSANSATAELTITASKFSFTPSTAGDLTATVSGDGIDGGSDTVQIISTSGPPITISFDMPAYTFAEDATDEAVYAMATLNAAYPRPPSFPFDAASFSSRGDTATSPEDYRAISDHRTFSADDFERDDDTDPLVARTLYQDFIVNDDIYEGSESFMMKIEAGPGLSADLLQFAYPDGTTCAPYSCSLEVEYSVTITDEGDLPALSLSAVPSSIAEEDDSATTLVAENASVLTVAAASPKTFATDQAITLTFDGTAVYGTHYSVSPVDTDANAMGHQVTAAGGLTASVQVTVTATANDTADGRPEHPRDRLARRDGLRHRDHHHASRRRDDDLHQHLPRPDPRRPDADLDRDGDGGGNYKVWDDGGGTWIRRQW